ncbi:MAG: fibronectin type III domain-containing protein [Verrucomicrobia bacterium]|nr:fibronectin type III domain-containing protein [Verrucomicrobiota bacterium]
MGKVKIAIRGLSVPQKIMLARQREKALTDNAEFPDAAGPLTNYSTRTNELEEAFRSRNVIAAQLTSAQMKLDRTELAWDQESALLGTYVQMRSGGVESKIVSGGHAVSSRARKAVPLLRPEGLAITMGDQAGCLDLVWDPVDGRRAYIVQLSTDPDLKTWQQVATTCKSKASLKGLTPGVMYFIRVAALGAAGQGPWSQTIGKNAP